MYDQTIDTEISRVNQHSRNLLHAYLGLGQKIKSEQGKNTLYNDLLDFVNFRFETADTCLLLIEKEKIADALGLCRSLLENYMLFMLICRGYKLFKLQNLEGECKTDGEFKRYLRTRQQELEEQQKAGTTNCLAVKKYPRAKKHLMYIFEGLKDESEPSFMIPLHYFEFQNFHPERMRLKEEDYFVYRPPTASGAEAQKKHQQNMTFMYKHYLSYDALMQCLELNGIADKQAQAKIEAHYTFLGKYLHPTHDAARSLRQRNNWYSRQTVLGFDHPYEKEVVLLASLYVCFLVTGFLEEVAGGLENAPVRYISDAGTAELRSLTSQTAKRFSYFWFIFNEAPLWDKFNYCIHHVSDEELATFQHYSNIPSDRITFNMHIYRHLKDALGGSSNLRCGAYVSPLADSSR